MKAMFKNLAVSALVFLTASCGFAQNTPTMAPDFTVEDLNGRSVSLSDYKGKPVILLFWTVSCKICENELKALSGKYRDIKSGPVAFLMVNIADPKYRVENFLSTYGLDFDVLLDKEARAAFSYDIPGVPTYFVINKNGEIIAEDYTFPTAEYERLRSEAGGAAAHE